MIAKQRENAPAHPHRQLAEMCLDQLAREEPVLRTTLDLLRRTRQALLRADITALAACLEQHGQVAAARTACDRAREALKNEISAWTGVPRHQASMSLLMARFPSEMNQRLGEHRDRLRLLAQEVDCLNRDNAILTSVNLEFMRQLLLTITGGTNAPKRYGPAGALQEPDCGPIVSAQG